MITRRRKESHLKAHYCALSRDFIQPSFKALGQRGKSDRFYFLEEALQNLLPHSHRSSGHLQIFSEKLCLMSSENVIRVVILVNLDASTRQVQVSQCE